MVGHRVGPAVTPGVAARQTAQCQVAASGRAMVLYRPDGVAGATGAETAVGADPGSEQQLVRAHQQHQQTAHHGRALASSCCSSARTAFFNAGDDALGNSDLAKPARSRTRCAASANWSAPMYSALI
eukprot:Opistho-2@36067